LSSISRRGAWAPARLARRWSVRSAALLLALATARAVPAVESPRALEVMGMRLEVSDLPQSIRFYTGGLGFDLLVRGADGALLRNGSTLLSLRRVATSSSVAGGAVRADFEVRNLKEALEELGKLNVKVLEKRTQPIANGVLLTIQDPAGNLQQLLVFSPSNEALTRPRLSGLEVEVSDVERAREFYSGILDSQSPRAASRRRLAEQARFFYYGTLDMDGQVTVIAHVATRGNDRCHGPLLFPSGTRCRPLLSARFS
jgi:catechol 2,3-dioxygenase-like lactoylglutathione lyase family enzyme